MSLTTKKCFDIAIALITQHHKEDLLAAFLNILKEQFPKFRLECYDVNNGLLSSKEALFKESLYRCVASRRTLFIEQEQLFIYPVVSQGKVTQIIVLQGELLSQNLSLLKQLTTLFSNQQILVDSNNHDPLTSLLNRHAFESRIANITETGHRRSDENSSQYCFAIFDIDFFKRVNDDYGHLYGDEVLILFSNLMEETFRHGDMLFRYGGEEFAVILKDIDIDTAVAVLDRFRNIVENYNFPQVGTITVSIGVTAINPTSSRVGVISKADQALYFSKENGRNQVNSFAALLSSGKITGSDTHSDDIELF